MRRTDLGFRKTSVALFCLVTASSFLPALIALAKVVTVENKKYSVDALVTKTSGNEESSADLKVLNKADSTTKTIHAKNVGNLEQSFVLGDYFVLLCHSPSAAMNGGPLYDLVQVNLVTGELARFEMLEKYSVSPDRKYLLATVYGEAPGIRKSDDICLIGSLETKAKLKWIYSQDNNVNLFTKSNPGIESNVGVLGPFGWSNEDQEAAFAISAFNVSPTDEKIVSKQYLARVKVVKDDLTIGIKPIDISGYRGASGLHIVKVLCNNKFVTLKIEKVHGKIVSVKVPASK